MYIFILQEITLPEPVVQVYQVIENGHLIGFVNLDGSLYIPPKVHEARIVDPKYDGSTDHPAWEEGFVMPTK